MKKYLLFLLALLMTGLSVWASDVNLTEDQDELAGTAARWYVNMPQTGTNTLTLANADIPSFKVYDNGGKSGDYDTYCSGTLVITAPEGYILQISGSVSIRDYGDYLTVYDGSDASGNILIDQLSGIVDITPVVSSTGQSLTLYFKSDSFQNRGGLDLTVTLVNPNENYDITIITDDNGFVESDKLEAKYKDLVTLTATPNDGFVLSGLSVKDVDNNEVTVDWITYLNTATFIMPCGAVTVTPTFTDDPAATSDAPYVNMPTLYTKNITIPEGVMRVKVYDDGGKNGNCSSNSNGYLVLTAPEGYNLRVSGTITAGGTNTYDHLTVYDGSDKNAPKLIDEAQSSNWYTTTSIPTVTSTGQTIMLWFYASWDNCKGLDLTVELVSISTEYDITVNNPDEGGTVSPDGATAVVNQTVTLTAEPDEGFVLTDLIVTDANNNLVDVTDMIWYTALNTATFSMPASDVTVTPTFTDDLTSLYINMPQTGIKTAVIPARIPSFKVYDNGGADNDYSFSCDGALSINAPEGYKIQLSGRIMTSQDDYFTVYDNNEASGNKLLDAAVSADYYEWTDIPTLTSTGQSMTLYFYADDSAGLTDGLDLTVTLIPPTFAINLPESFDHGTVECDKETATVGETVTLTVTPDPGYELENLTVTIIAGEPSGAPMLRRGAETVELTEGEDGIYTFEMPAAPVTVNATFKPAVNYGTLEQLLAGEDIGAINEDLHIGEAFVDDNMVYVADAESNWIGLKVTDDAMTEILESNNKVLKANTVLGIARDLDTNPVFEVTGVPELVEGAAALPVEINLSEVFSDITGNTLVKISGYYKGNRFTAYQSDTEGQSLAINNTYVATGDLVNNQRYNVCGVLRLKAAWDAATDGAPRRVAASNPDYFKNMEIVPYDIDIVTGVTDVNVNGEVASMKYVSVTGMVSDKPFEGVNIVVTRHTDGTTTTTKVIF